MPGYQEFSLDEIVNVAVLQEIQDKFTEVTGMGAVIVDSKGHPVTTAPSNFTEFCCLIRSKPEGLNRCMASDARGGRMAEKRHSPYVYHCHSGLTDLASPIIVNNQYMGAFLVGQVVVADELEYDTAAEVRRRTGDLDLDQEVLASLLERVEVVAEKRVKAAADLLYIMSNYIVEMGMVNISQKQLMSEMKAKGDLEKMLREAEIKALQAQINPHFLFNALNTIARLALLEGAKRTEEVVYALSDLLRNNLRANDQLATVREELSYIKDYLLIQQARFGDRITAELEIPEDLMEEKIPGFTLQPLVENAIIHGLEPKKGGGKISIAGRSVEQGFIISVSDSGVGITPEKVREIFSQEKRVAGKGHTTGLGLINVHKRIQLSFGAEYGLTMTGQPDIGTCVYIYLPRS